MTSLELLHDSFIAKGGSEQMWKTKSVHLILEAMADEYKSNGELPKELCTDLQSEIEKYNKLTGELKAKLDEIHREQKNIHEKNIALEKEKSEISNLRNTLKDEVERFRRELDSYDKQGLGGIYKLVTWVIDEFTRRGAHPTSICQTIGAILSQNPNVIPFSTDKVHDIEEALANYSKLEKFDGGKANGRRVL